MPNKFRVEQVGLRLEVSDSPVSPVMGVVTLPFAAVFGFITVAAFQSWLSAPGVGPLTMVVVIFLAAAFLGFLAVFTLSHQRLILDSSGLVLQRRLLFLTIYRRRIPLEHIGQATSPSIETEEGIAYSIEIPIGDRAFSFGFGGDAEELRAIAHQINELKARLKKNSNH